MFKLERLKAQFVMQRHFDKCIKATIIVTLIFEEKYIYIYAGVILKEYSMWIQVWIDSKKSYRKIIHN